MISASEASCGQLSFMGGRSLLSMGLALSSVGRGSSPSLGIVGCGCWVVILFMAQLSLGGRHGLPG